MEKQQLPNSTLILVFGILSIPLCCCYGIVGLILGIVALVLAKKATAQYLENPELYTGFSNVKTGRILAIIGIVFSAVYILMLIAGLAMYGTEIFNEEFQQQMLEQYQ